ncbi:hypothetical protein [Haloferax sp. DFSO52]|uniref:hypothetical protein n=1 Tax=Haloferax sp. DFSO52 TaxID=3388505 RepID=UPI003A861500
MCLVSESKSDVDEMHDALADVARGSPQENDADGIYQFFADDPDGRAAEFQVFLD